MTGSGPENQISKVRLISYKKREKERMKWFTFQDPNAPEKISCELFFRSMVPRLVNRCQGKCGDKLFSAGKEDYLVVKSREGFSAMNNQDEMSSKYCRL